MSIRERMSVRDDLLDVKVSIAGTNREFFVTASFPAIVPITKHTEESRAVHLHQNLTNSIQSRLHIFHNILNLVARQGKLEHWQELDVGLTALVMLLKEKGLNGALKCIEPAVQGAASVASGCRSTY